MRAAIYARVSTADGRQDTENQLAELRRFASTQGWEIVSEYIDHESGGRADRAEFRRMFADAAQRQFDILLFWALDRLTREGALKTLQYLNQLSNYGVDFRSFTNPTSIRAECSRTPWLQFLEPLRNRSAFESRNG